MEWAWDGEWEPRMSCLWKVSSNLTFADGNAFLSSPIAIVWMKSSQIPAGKTTQVLCCNVRSLDVTNSQDPRAVGVGVGGSRARGPRQNDRKPSCSPSWVSLDALGLWKSWLNPIIRGATSFPWVSFWYNWYVLSFEKALKRNSLYLCWWICKVEFKNNSYII